MEARYALELRDRDPATVEDLVLDGCEATEISGIDDKLVNLQSLSLINVGLLSLKGLPKLLQLTKLDLSDNKISDGLDIVASNCPELLHLNLASNKITNLDILSVFKDSHLAELDLFSNPVSNPGDEAYRSKVFDLIPSLQILDGCDVNGEEVEDSIDGEASGEEEDSGDEDESGSEVDGPGLSYLDNSQLDEDETEDYEPTGDLPKGSIPERRGTKRRNEANGGQAEPEAKKSDD
uniref:LRRcap domain-containing protein n=1 Tax=Heterorhabditis bacteriophora TaxID=37862 RepID=A0A1I7WS27_HETBA